MRYTVYDEMHEKKCMYESGKSKIRRGSARRASALGVTAARNFSCYALGLSKRNLAGFAIIGLPVGTFAAVAFAWIVLNTEEKRRFKGASIACFGIALIFPR